MEKTRQFYIRAILRYDPRSQLAYASCEHAPSAFHRRKDTHLLVQVQLQAAVFLLTPKCVHCRLPSMRLTACQNRKSVIKRECAMEGQCEICSERNQWSPQPLLFSSGQELIKIII